MQSSQNVRREADLDAQSLRLYHSSRVEMAINTMVLLDVYNILSVPVIFIA